MFFVAVKIGDKKRKKDDKKSKMNEKHISFVTFILFENILFLLVKEYFFDKKFCFFCKLIYNCLFI